MVGLTQYSSTCSIGARLTICRTSPLVRPWSCSWSARVATPSSVWREVTIWSEQRYLRTYLVSELSQWLTSYVSSADHDPPDPAPTSGPRPPRASLHLPPRPPPPADLQTPYPDLPSAGTSPAQPHRTGACVRAGASGGGPSRRAAGQSGSGPRGWRGVGAGCLRSALLVRTKAECVI